MKEFVVVVVVQKKVNFQMRGLLKGDQILEKVQHVSEMVGKCCLIQGSFHNHYHYYLFVVEEENERGEEGEEECGKVIEE